MLDVKTSYFLMFLSAGYYHHPNNGRYGISGFAKCLHQKSPHLSVVATECKLVSVSERKAGDLVRFDDHREFFRVSNSLGRRLHVKLRLLAGNRRVVECASGDESVSPPERRHDARLIRSGAAIGVVGIYNRP